MTSFIRKALLIGSLFLVSACMTLPNTFSSGDTEEFDGTWSGRIMLSIGEERCIRRTSVTVSIEDGGLNGKLRHQNYEAKISGVITEDGTLKSGIVEVPNDFYNYKLNGTFEGEAASGTWKNKDCAGKWKLRRTRKTTS